MSETTAIRRRVNSYSGANRRMAAYEDGSAVRRIEGIAADIPAKPKQRKRTVSAAEQAISVNRFVVAFLAVCCILTTCLCVGFLQERAHLTSLTEEIGILESQYTSIKADNDAKYNQIMSTFTLETVKDEALNRLGMHYAEADQVQYYHLVQDSYVRQYQEVTQAD
ncbi:MAG: hypothetical protein IKG70_01590 [Lachnospiraceae bacterium]|nr:hypothetical protein [Lachnospiraceae bacterium]